MNYLKNILSFIIKNPLLLLIGMSSLVYFNSLNNGFVNLDDLAQVYKNNKIQDLNFENLKLLFTGATLSMYQPLTSISFAGIAAVFGIKSATPFHVFSFLLHLINLLLVYFIGVKIFKNKSKSIFLSLLFSLHPFAVEVVSWVSATSTLLFSFFFLSALYFYLKYIEINRGKYYFFSLILFIIGCFCKVQIIPFVGVLFLVDYLYKKPLFSKKILFQKIPFILVAVIFGVIALNFRNQELAKNVGNIYYSNFYFALHQTGWYFVKLFAPFNYSVIYNWPEKLTVIHHLYTLVILPVIYLMYRFRRNRLFIFGVLFFLINIVLHTTLFSKMISPYAVRYTYISSLGIWIAVLNFSYKNHYIYLGILFLGFLTILAKQQTRIWKSSKTLFESSLETEPNLAFAHGNLGVFYIDSDPEKAEKHFLKAASLEPSEARYFNNVGYIYKDKDAVKSEKYYLKALQLNPNYVNSLNNIGDLYLKSNPRKAEQYFLKAAALKVNNAEYYDKLGSIYKDTDTIKAKKYYLKALKSNSNYLNSLNNLGILYLKSHPQKAEQYFLKAINIKPNSAIYYNNIGYIYKDTDRKKAEKFYLKALQIDSNYVNSLNNIGNLYMKTYPEKAEKYFLKAINLNSDRAIEFYNSLGDTFKNIDSLKSLNYFLRAEELKK